MLENLYEKSYKNPLILPPFLYGFIGYYNVLRNEWDSEIPVTICSGDIISGL